MVWSVSVKQIKNINILKSYNSILFPSQILPFSTTTMDTTKSVMDAHAKDTLTLEKIKKAGERLEGSVHRTPIMTCSYLDKLAGDKRRLLFKCENFQKTGSFKVYFPFMVLHKFNNNTPTIVPILLHDNIITSMSYIKYALKCLFVLLDCTIYFPYKYCYIKDDG